MIKFKLVHKFTSVNCAFHVVACPDNLWERVSKSASETKRNITHYLTHSLLYLGQVKRITLAKTVIVWCAHHSNYLFSFVLFLQVLMCSQQPNSFTIFDISLSLFFCSLSSL